MTIRAPKTGASPLSTPTVVAKPKAPEVKPPSRAARAFAADEMSSGRGGALRRNAASLLGAQLPVSALAKTTVASTMRAGGGGGPPVNPYDSGSEFGLPTSATWSTYGAAAASALQRTIDTLRGGGEVELSTRFPQEGDVMLWAPNAGDYDSMVGQADENAHAALVSDVTNNGDGTITVRVSEQNWDGGEVDDAGVPYRDLTFVLNDDGTVSLPNGSPLPDGVGFVHVNPDTPVLPTASVPLGDAEVPTDIALPDTVINTTDGYTGCVGYIKDRGDFAHLFPMGATVNGGDIEHSSQTPREGSLMVWSAGAGDDVFTAGSQGHVAYIERVTPNLEDGVVVSYTITVSEGLDPDLQNPRLRAFTVPANPDGTADLPDDVGFNHSGSGVTTQPSTAAPTGSVPSGRYTVQANDTLWGIAARAGVDYAALVAANPGINVDLLSIGQVINVP